MVSRLCPNDNSQQVTQEHDVTDYVCVCVGGGGGNGDNMGLGWTTEQEVSGICRWSTVSQSLVEVHVV